MSNKITIDGKEYTERSISSLNIDGELVSGNVISSENVKPGQRLQVNIRVSSDIFISQLGEANEIKTIENTEIINTVETLEIPSEINEDNITTKTDTSKKESLINKCILWIKVFFKSFF